MREFLAHKGPPPPVSVQISVERCVHMSCFHLHLMLFRGVLGYVDAQGRQQSTHEGRQLYCTNCRLLTLSGDPIVTEFSGESGK